jgi:hypothetical protein
MTELPDDLPEIMGLERDALERVAHRTQQWGKSLERSLSADRGSDQERVSVRGEEQLRREIASLFTIAGSYQLLLRASSAVEPLHAAADHFVAVGSPYAHALAVCGGDQDAAWVGRLGDGDRPLSAADRALVLLRLGWLDTSLREPQGATRQALFAHIERAAPVGPTEVGRLRVPLDATLRVLRNVDAMLYDDVGRGIDALAVSARDFLTRAHDVTAAAMADSFHWRNMLSSVLPVEPEAAALGAVVMAGAMRHQADDELMDRVNLPGPAVAPLVVGRAIAERAW